MSGSRIVRAYRNGTLIEGQKPSPWRKRIVAAAIASSVVALGSIIVKAQDSSGVYEIARQYNPVRSAVRAVQIPQVFQPSRVQVTRTSLNYAPVFQNLMPVAATGKRDLDSARNGQIMNDLAGSPRTIKVTPRQKSAASREDFVDGYLSSSTSYCVRTCDGFFFPVGNPQGGDTTAHEAACQRACPGAETALYVAPAGSTGIADAVTRKGQRYEAMSTAFNYRTQFDNACSCNGPKPRNHSVMSDFTLRKGDIVMSREGLKVFQGGDRWPHRASQFSRIDNAGLSGSERAALQKLEAASMRNTSTGQLSPGLKARIAAQVEAATRVQQGPGTNRLAAQVARKVQTANGREMRYVGPDIDFDRAR